MKLLQEIPKGALNTMGAALGISLLALLSKAIRQALGLSMSDTAISSIRFWLLLVGIGTLFSVGWFLFFRTLRKLRAVEVQLVGSLAKKGVFDFLSPVKGKGYDIDTRTGEAVCPKCTTNEKAVPMRDNGKAYYCFVCDNGVLK